MITKKFISVLLCVAVVLTSFPISFTAAAAVFDADTELAKLGYKLDGEPILFEDFIDSGGISGVKNTWSGYEADYEWDSGAEALKVSGTGTKYDAVFFPLNTSLNSGMSLIEFDVSTTDSSKWSVALNNSVGTANRAIYNSTFVNGASSGHFAVLIDYSAHSWFSWNTISGTLVSDSSENFYRNNNTTKYSYLMIYINSTNTHSINIDNIKQTAVTLGDKKMAAEDKALLEEYMTSRYDLTMIKSDMVLPSSGEKYGSEIVWESTNETYLSPLGKYTAPLDVDENVTLTAYIKRNDVTVDSAAFNITVKSRMSDLSCAEADKAWLDEYIAGLTGYPDKITGHILLPKKGEKQGSTISYTSSDSSVISPDGYVKASRREALTVTLTAAISYGTANLQSVYNLTVPKSSLPRPELDSTTGKELYAVNLDFSGIAHVDSFDFWHSKSSKDGAEFANGKMKLTPPESETRSNILYFSDYTANIDDRLVYEFDLARDKQGKFQIYLSLGGGTGKAAKTAYLDIGADTINYYNTGGKLVTACSYTETEKPIHILIRFDKTDASISEGNKYLWSMWADGVKVVSNAENSIGNKLTSASLVDTLGITTEAGGAAVTIDNLRVFKAEANDADYAHYDAMWLSEEINKIDKDRVITDLTLPTIGYEHGSNISWSSSNEAVIASDGTVSRPSDIDTVDVTLTAVIDKNGSQTIKSYTFTVIGQMSDDTLTAKDKLWLIELLKENAEPLDPTNDAEENILTKSIYLPETGFYGSDITWQSSASSIISPYGYVKPSRRTSETVTVTASLSYGVSSDEITYEIKVPKSALTRPALDNNGNEIFFKSMDFDDFLDTDLPSEKLVWFSRADAGDSYFDGGRLKFPAVSTGSHIISLLNSTEEKEKINELGDRLVYEFDLSRDTASKATVFLTRSGSVTGSGAALWFDITGSTIVPYINGIKGTAIPYTDTERPVHILIRFDKTSDTSMENNSYVWSMWIDGELKAEKKLPYHNIQTLSVLDGFAVRTEQGGAEITIDNLRIYQAEITPTEMLKSDLDWLTEAVLTSENINSVKTKLNLPSKGKYGTDIVWTVSGGDGSVRSDGTIVRFEDGDRTATLTANLTAPGFDNYPSENGTKDFTVIVKKYSRYQKAGVKTLLIEDDLKGNDINNLINIENGEIEASADGIVIDAGDKLSIAFDGKGTGYTDILSYEFYIDEGTAAEFYDKDNTLCFAIKKESAKLWYKTASPAGDMWVEAANDSGEFINILLDPMTGSFSLWQGDVQEVANVPGIKEASAINKMTVEKLSGQGLIHSLRAYIADVPADAALQFDASWLEMKHITYQDSSDINQDICLPTVGRYGSDLIWETDEAVISSSGTLASEYGVLEDTQLKAVITNGTDSIEKIFDITVNRAAPTEMPEETKRYITENFDNNIIDDANVWTISQANGIVSSTEETMKLIRTGYDQINEDGATILTGAELLFDPMGIYLQGVYVSEFTIRFIEDCGLCIRLRGDGDYCAMNYNGSTGYVGIYANGNNYNSNIYKVGGDGKSAHFKVLYYTSSSTFTVWINGDLVMSDVGSRTTSPGGIRSGYFYIDGEQTGNVEIDNIKFYEAYPLSQKRIELDKEWLTENVIVNENDPAYEYGTVSMPLNLMTTGKYGSTISWQSSDSAIIDSDGNIYPRDTESPANLTANLSAGTAEPDSKSFTFTLVSGISDDEVAIAKDYDALTAGVVAKYDGGSLSVKRSLNFVTRGAYGSEISWSTSNKEYITSSGRIIRPRFDCENAEVTVTATLTRGSAVRTKSFNLTVLADEEFISPSDAMPDSEFFGVWNGEEYTVEGKLDYTYPGLETLGEIVKSIGTSGDYTAAKEELLRYFREVRKSKTTITASSQQTGWAKMLSDDFYHLQNGQYYQGSGYFTSDWEIREFSVKTSELSAGNTVTYSLRSWYNESSVAEIYRKNSEDVSKRPKLKLIINDSKTVYVEAEDDANIRAGSYSGTNLNNETYLKLQTYGDFLEDNTRHAVVRFSLDSLAKGDKVTEAYLVLYGRAIPASAGEKDIIILKEPNSSWNSESVVWDSFLGKVYSFNGLPDKNHWENIDGADGEYQPQSSRFLGWGALSAEYMLTKNEDYAYKAIRIMEDFISDTAYWRSVGNENGASVYDPINGIRGAYRRTLDAVGRAGSWSNTIDLFFKSRYATPTFCTEVMKSLWDTGNYLTIYNTTSGNWRQYEFECILKLANRIPEFTDSKSGKNWYKIGKDEIERMFLQLNSLSDGSYKEACDSYASSAYSGYVDFKAEMIAAGGDVSDEYTARLRDMSYYIASLYAPDGTGIQWGDAAVSKRSSSPFINMARWIGDKELEYIATYGSSGTEPEFTSQYFPESTVASLRDNWTKNSPWLFTNARGGGQHGHRDSNSIVLFAYGRNLLTDAGIFSYTGTDPYRQWGISSVAHNTVVINDASQTRYDRQWEDVNSPFTNSATKYGFSTNDGFDWLSQSTPQTPGFDHRRTVTYIKPDIFIVSDLMIPQNKESSNNYKQIWHMLPDAGLAVSDTEHTIYSNYSNGANIIISSADGDTANTMIESDKAWYDRGYQVLEDSPYGYFEKNNARGNTALDTVIMVSNNDATAAISSQKLSLPSDTSKVALKLEFTKNNREYTGYFYMSYDSNPSVYTITDGGVSFETDAALCYVQLDKNGTVASYLLKDGSYIKDSQGRFIFKADDKVSEFQVDVTSMDVYVNGSSDVLDANANVYSPVNVSKLLFNNKAVGFAFENNIISDIGKTPAAGSDETVGGAPSGGIVIPSDNSGGGGGTGGSTGVGGGTGSGTLPSVFNDIEGHWAQAYITTLFNSGVVQGNGLGTFNPNDNITRAEFTAMTIRALGYDLSQYDNSFDDISSGDWYALVVQTALDHGLISPADNFRPGDYITREEMAKIISQAAKLYEYFFPGAVDMYKDSSSVSEWSVKFVSYVTQSGLMNGNTDGSFEPMSNATRAETAAVICRMIDWINNINMTGVNR